MKMEKDFNVTGYNLYTLSLNSWILDDGAGHVFNGTLIEVTRYAVKELKFVVNEIEVALDDMLKKEHDGAHFGGNRTFIYSFNRKAKNVVRTAS
jgi:hypothetical protein